MASIESGIGWDIGNQFIYRLNNINSHDSNVTDYMHEWFKQIMDSCQGKQQDTQGGFIDVFRSGVKDKSARLTHRFKIDIKVQAARRPGRG